MQIKITTTEVKLSKSFLNQMYRGEDRKILDSCNVLGYILGAVKNISKIILIEKMGEYYVLATNWEKRERSIVRINGWSRQVGYFYQTKKFNTVEECNTFWELLQDAINKATEHIYI